MNSSRPIIAFLSNYPVPYQAEFVRALDREGSLDVRAIFLRDRDPRRDWPGETLAGQARFLPLLGPRRLRDELKPAMRLGEAGTAALLLLGGYSYLAFQQALRARAWAARPTLVWAETPRVESGGILKKSIRRALLAPLRETKGILAIGAHAAQVWREALDGAVPVIDFPYVCDIDRYLSLERQPRSDGAFRLLFSGQLIARKGVDLLARAFLIAQHRAPQLRLIIVGSGPERAAVERALAPAAPGSVEFRGSVPWSSLPLLYADADAFCLPSRHDGWGLVINEAMAAGLPIIASSAVGAATALIRDRETGLLVPPGDVEALAEAILTLIPIAPALGRAAREVARVRLQPAAAAARFARLARAAIASEPLEGL